MPVTTPPLPPALPPPLPPETPVESAPPPLPPATDSRPVSGFARTPHRTASITLPQRQHLRSLIKAAAAVITLGLIVFLKLDRLAGNWYAGSSSESPPTITLPKPPTAPSGEKKVIDTLSLREHFTFTPKEAREFPDLNLRFQMPGDAWAFARDPWAREGSVFSLTKIQGGRGAKDEIGEAQFSLRVLPAGTDPGMDQNRAAAAVQVSLRALGGGHRIAGREEVQLNGLRFSRIEIEDLTMNHRRHNAEVWVYVLNGMIYEMITTMPDRTPTYYLSQTARRLAEGFAIIDPAKVLQTADVMALLETAGALPAPNAPVEYGNVSLRLKPEVWSTWPGAQNTLPGNAMAWSSRSGLRMAAAFTPIEGLPDDPARTAALIGNIWPSLRDFQWGRPGTRPHEGQRTAVIHGSGPLNSRTGIAEVRAVRCGSALMVLFAFGPGDTKPESLTTCLDQFKVQPSANGDPDFGIIEEREFHRFALGAFAEDATANGRHAEASAMYMTLFEWDRLTDDLCSASRSLAAAGKKDEAFKLITDNEGRHAGEPEWEAQKMLLLAGIGKPEDSLHTAVKLLKTGALAASMAGVYIETLIDSRSFTEAQSFVKILTEIDTSPVWRLYNALLMAETGNRSKSAPIVRAVRTAAPDDLELAVECVNVLMRCRLYPEALELARFLALKNPQREQMQLLAAACHTALGHTTEAREAYQKILTANPGSVVARAALDALAASSGQEGSQEIVAASIPPVPLPPALAAKLPKPSAPLADAEGQSVVHLYRITGLQLHTSNPLRQTVRGAVRILDEEGMSQFNTMRFPVHPQSQRLCVHHLRVLDPAGNTAAEASLSDHYSLDSASSGMATSGKVIHVPVPGLKPGCTIEYAYTIESIGSTGSIEYTRHLFALPEPCRFDSWFITGDTAKMKFASSRNLEPLRDGDSLVWMETKPAVLSSSLLLSGGADNLPMLHAGVPSASWGTLGRDYLDQIRDRLATNANVSKTAQDTITGLKDRTSRVAALTALVRDSISYTAIEFGARAIIPNPAAATLANRYGDCKDQSVLLHQLLTAGGIPSHLCLINSRGAIHRDFPCLAQFDHMIVALPIPGGKGYDFIDPTNKYMPPVAGAAPLGLQGRAALVLDPAGPVLSDTATFTPASEIVTRRDIEVRASGDAILRDAITFTGSRAARLRALLSPLPPIDRTAALRQLIGFDRISHHVRDIRIQNLKELDTPLRIVIQWEARGCLRSEQDQLRLSLPTIIESRLLTADSESADESSDYPLQISAPVRIRSEMALKLPPGHVLSAGSLTGDKAESAFGKWSLSVTPPGTERTAHLVWECSLLPATLAPEKKRPFIDFTHDSLRRLQADWSFTAEAIVKQ